MMTEILAVILLTASFLGLTSFLYLVSILLLRPEKTKYTVVLAASSSDSDTADKICKEIMRQELLGENERGSVIVLDCGMSEKNRRRCDDFCRETKKAFVCRPDELSNVIADIQKKT
ncbi:MAG: hypothetical protein K6F09_06780 [Clostridiales bacterium]|nr:hypothetical protein [Clostridiales bacterium]